MSNSTIVIYPTDVHRDPDKARLGVVAAAEALDVKYDLLMSSSWIIFIERKDQATFLEFAREEANA